MARITVEDCIDKFPSRFELVLVASQRARKLHSGDEPTIEKNNDKNTVIALREIADGAITTEQMKENLIQEYQVVTINDEEDENLELELNQSNDNENSTDLEIKSINSHKEVGEEMDKLVQSVDLEIEDQYEIKENSYDDLESNDDTKLSEKVESQTDGENI